jgi:hypothetical protein
MPFTPNGASFWIHYTDGESVGVDDLDSTLAVLALLGLVEGTDFVVGGPF